MPRSYISELLGQPKRKENLADLLSSSSVLSLRLGRVDVRFQQPWSLREFVTQQMSRMPGQIDSNSQRISYTERGRILRTLGYRVLSDINNVSVMMPTALVGTVLLTLRGRGEGKRGVGPPTELGLRACPGERRTSGTLLSIAH